MRLVNATLINLLLNILPRQKFSLDQKQICFYFSDAYLREAYLLSLLDSSQTRETINFIFNELLLILLKQIVKFRKSL